MNDGGEPARSATQVLTININQNLHTPEFDAGQDPCSADISEDFEVGATIDSVLAVDLDRLVSFFL